MSENDHKYHKPDEAGIEKIQRIRQAVIDLEKLYEEVSTSDPRSLAVAKTYLETSRMWAIKGIVMQHAVDPKG
jgi:hypothetical protein